MSNITIYKMRAHHCVTLASLVALSVLATVRAETQKPKPDYSAPADAPYIAEEVVVKTPAGHTLAGTLTLPKGASRAKPVGAIVTVTGRAITGQEGDNGTGPIS